jgi:hypothetical protein
MAALNQIERSQLDSNVGQIEAQNQNDSLLANTQMTRVASASFKVEEKELTFLPKVYNGKTVTDLFPEFKYNAVIFYSESSPQFSFR